MTTENTTPNVLPEIKPAEIVSTDGDHRLVRISFQNMGHLYGIQEQLANLGSGGVTLHYLCSEKKPKSFILSDREMDTLCEAWLQYRRDYIEHVAREQAEYEAGRAELLGHCCLRAEKYGIIIGASIGPEPVYSLTFPDGSRWDQFWASNDDLSLSDVDFRLDFIAARDETVREEMAHAAALAIGALMARRESNDE
jgi:hypothetical protein